MNCLHHKTTVSRTKQWGLNMFLENFREFGHWTVLRFVEHVTFSVAWANCGASCVFQKRCFSQTGCLPKMILWYIVCDCVCVCVFVLQSPVLYHFITVTTCRLTSSIDLYSIFQSCSAGGWRSRHLRIGGIQTVVCQFDWTPLLGKSTQITWKSTTEGSSEVTCTDTWA